MKPKWNKAFTLTEVLVAVAIIGLLIALITMAIGKVMTSSKVAATRTVMQAGVSLFEEWRRNGATSYPTYPWPLNVTVSSGTVQLVPGDLSAGAPSLTGIGVGLTRATMNRFLENASVARLAGNMPAERFVLLPGMTGAATSLPGTVNIGQDYTASYTGQSGNANRYFICYNGLPAAAVAAAPTANDPTTWPANWRDYWMEGPVNPANGVPVPVRVPVDAWNNPMLLIPACGFQATDTSGNPILVTSDGIKTNNQFNTGGANFMDCLTWNTSRTYTVGQIVISPRAAAPAQWGLFVCTTAHTSGNLNQPDTAGGKNYWDRVPTMPFFASAGPDGIFFDPANPSTLQDNIYSFER